VCAVMRSVVIAVLVACVAAMVCAEDPVKVVVMTESLCPDCADFANNDLKEFMKAEGVFERASIRFLAWGNAYTETTSSELCPSPTPGKFVGSVLRCWLNRCVRTAEPLLFAECFNISFKDHITCQHGEEENLGNRIETCALYASRNGSDNALTRAGAEFIECFMGENHGKKEYTQVCAKRAGIDYDAVMSCVNSNLGYALLSEEAVETTDFGEHPGVPYVIVNGKPVPDDVSLLKAVCSAIQGTKPAGCKSMDESPRSRHKC